jgi:hypothetical protein
MQEWQNVEQKYLYASKEIDQPMGVGQPRIGAGQAMQE